MTDKRGYYSMQAPVGGHVVKAMMMGCLAGSEHIRVGDSDTVTVDFVLSKDPDYDPSTAIMIPEDPRLADVAWSLWDPWPYDASVEPVQWESLEFELRYVVAEQNDSVIVNVIAEGKNVTATPFAVCGRFAFWNVTFLPSPDVYAEIIRLGGRTRYEGPMLEVSGEKFVPGALECESVQVGPGESIARGMAFSFDPKEFETWTGEVSIRCYFFAGDDGSAWSDVWRIDLGEIRIPIRPIGQPLRVLER